MFWFPCLSALVSRPVGIFLAKVSRAISGRMPLLSKVV